MLKQTAQNGGVRVGPKNLGPYGLLVFALKDFWEPTDYVYKIWLSLVQGPRFLVF